MVGRVVAIGGSWGGGAALGRVLASLPGDLGAPVVVALHRYPGASRLAEQLGRHGPLAVADAEDKQELWPGCVLLAPPDYHLLVEGGMCVLSIDEPVRYSRPSIDVLFESVADAYRSRAVGVLLTGASEDGSAGLARIQARGGLTIAQDPASAECPIMPRAAIEAGAVGRVLGLEEIGEALVSACATEDVGVEEGAR
ncbi:MAG: chemotaxis protein CheB [Actinobacteria bacterium]|nr:MAG: chemotaxis protein CheB [Actinomycetota bacterium]